MKDAPVLAMRCRSSRECDKKEVCDRKERVCRPSKVQPKKSKATLAKECLEKGIPLTYERGEKKGQRKTREALRNCSRQKERTRVQTKERPLLERESQQKAALRKKFDDIIRKAFDNFKF